MAVMAKADQSILVRLMQEMASPEVVAAIDQALEENEREREDLLDLRKMAVRRHGDSKQSSARPAEETNPERGNVEAEPPSVSNSLTISELAERYKNDTDSSFKTLSHASHVHYETLLKMILRDYSDERLSDINARTLIQWHAVWSEGTNGSSAHAKIGQLRRLFSFGATMLEDADCTRLSLILNRLKFEVPKTRNEKMTTEQAEAICAKAHELGRPSIALCQAFQSDVRLRQKDVIGEWVPYGDRGESKIIEDNEKWMRGLLWEEIDDNLILRKQTTFGDIAFDLHLAPMVMQEFHLQFAFDLTKHDRSKLPPSGPIIVSEYDKLPWKAIEFRRWWRKIADAAGVPPEVKNSDSRKSD